MPAPRRTASLTLLALLAFAGNSLLCRLALREGAIDPYGFTALRLAAGALVLSPFLRGPRRWNPKASLCLLGYALGFSLAYVTLGAGTGALLLFGMVQVTMIGAGWRSGERPTAQRALGVLIASAGVVWLCLPGVSAPDPLGAALMAGAGIAWGLYSLSGRATQRPATATACNFLLAAPLGLLALLVGAPELSITGTGALLAILSGALTSGLGYVLWYATLPGHTATSAAVVQLLVPVLAAGGGVAFLGEPTTPRLYLAGALTLGGVALAVLARPRGADRGRG